MTRSTSYLNPLGEVLRLSRPELVDVINTTGIQYESSSSISEYPVERGAVIADHALARPDILIITGQVSEHSLEGRGPSEVDKEFREMLTLGTQVSITTPRGTWENCVVTKVSSTQTPRNVYALEISVEFTQILLAQIDESERRVPIDEDERRVVGAFDEADTGTYADVIPEIVTPDKINLEIMRIRLQNFNARDFIQRQFEYYVSQGIDPNDLTADQRSEIGRKILDFTSAFYATTNLSDFQYPIINTNVWEIPLLEHTGRARSNPLKFYLRGDFQTDDQQTFKLELLFRYVSVYMDPEVYREFVTERESLFGNLAPEPLPRITGWYLSFRLSRPFEIPVVEVAVAQRSFVGHNIKLTSGQGVKLESGDKIYGYLFIQPRDSLRQDFNDSEEVSRYRAFARDENGRGPTFRMIFVNDPRVLLRPPV